jgi:hypothetical protein
MECTNTFGKGKDHAAMVMIQAVEREKKHLFMVVER